MNFKLKRIASLSLAVVLALTPLSSGFAASQTVSQSKTVINQIKPVTDQKVHNEKKRKSEWDNELQISPNKTVPSFKISEDSKYATDRIIVKYKTDTAANNVRSKYKLNKVKNLSSTKAEVVKVPNGKSISTVINELKKDSNVEYVQPDYKYLPTTNDPHFNELWGLHNVGQWYGTEDVDIDAPEAWNITQGSNDLVIGVIDEGIDITHPDLVNNIWTNPGEIPGNGIDDDKNGYIDDVYGWDFFNNDNTVFDQEDGDSHGTHVAGTIAASANNNTGIVGVAPNVKVMSLKFLGPDGGYTSDAILAIEYAKNLGVKITNNSWGGGSYDKALKDAIEASGALFVAAAGNDGMNLDKTPHYPASYDSSNILSVAAVDNNGYLANFSNYGTSVDVAAPGVNILSTTPNNSYEYYNGTSMATPHVAGIAALLYSHDPTLTPIEMIQRIKSTGTPLQQLSWGTTSNGRLVNAYNALTNAELSSDDEIPGVPYYDIVNDSLTYGIDNDDVYSIYLEEGQTLNVSLSGDAKTDFDLYLYSPEAYTIKTSDGIVAYSENEGTSTESIKYIAQYSGVYYLNVYSYAGTGNYTLIAEKESGGIYEDSNSLLYYYGNWQILDNSEYSEGTIHQLNSRGEVGFSFKGSSFEWIGTKNAQQGIANVYIDGMLVGTPSLYSATTLHQQTIFSHVVPEGYHYVEIQWTGKREPQARKTSTNINIDYFKVTSFEDTEAPVLSNVLPKDGATVLAQFTITGIASDNHKVDGVYATWYYNYDGKKIQRAKKIDLNPVGFNKKSTKNSAMDVMEFEIDMDLEVDEFPEGPVHFEIYAYDISGNRSEVVYRTYNYTTQEQEPIVTRIEDNDSLVVYSGTWLNASSNNYSGGKLKYSNEANASAELTFTGTGISWISMMSAAYGLVDVYIDGEFVETVNLYSSAAKYQQTVFEKTDLSNTSHTIMLVNKGQKGNPSATGARISVDAFEIIQTGSDTVKPVVELISPEDGATVPSQFNLIGSASDNVAVESLRINYMYNDINGEKLSYTDEVPINQIGTKSNNKANDILNFDIPVDLEQIKGIVEGPFSIEVFAIDTSGNESDRVYRTYYYEKQVQEPIVTRIEDNESLVVYSGTWLNASSNNYSGGTLKYSNEANASAELTFTGTGISWISMMSAAYGLVDVYIDGEFVETVNLYSSSAKYQQTVFEKIDLSNTSHTIKLVNKGQKGDPSGTNTRINVDAFEIIQSSSDTEKPVIELISPVEGATVPSQFNLIGSASDNVALKSIRIKYIRNDNGNNKVIKTEEVPFNQTGEKGTNKKARATWDFELPVDLENPFKGIIEGPFSIEVIAVDTSNNESDRIYRTYYYEKQVQEPIITEIEDNNSSIVYAGSWLSASSNNYSGGTLKYSNEANASAELTFTGTGISWISMMSAAYGFVDVYIDGEFVETVNLYSSSAKYQQTVFEKTDLSNTSHTIKLVNKGQKGNPSATGTRISVDAFKIIQK